MVEDGLNVHKLDFGDYNDFPENQTKFWPKKLISTESLGKLVSLAKLEGSFEKKN